MARLNDTERELWVRNDEGLYGWWKESQQRRSMRAFIRENGTELDAAINRALGEEPAPKITTYENYMRDYGRPTR